MVHDSALIRLSTSVPLKMSEISSTGRDSKVNMAVKDTEVGKPKRWGILTYHANHFLLLSVPHRDQHSGSLCSVCSFTSVWIVKLLEFTGLIEYGGGVWVVPGQRDGARQINWSGLEAVSMITVKSPFPSHVLPPSISASEDQITRIGVAAYESLKSTTSRTYPSSGGTSVLWIPPVLPGATPWSPHSQESSVLLGPRILTSSCDSSPTAELPLNTNS